MKYKVGDRVRIRSDLVVDEEFDEYGFVEDMEQFKGKVVTISRVSNFCYSILEDNGDYNYTDGMIECKVEQETNYDHYREEFEKLNSEVEGLKFQCHIRTRVMNMVCDDGMTCKECMCKIFEWLNQPYQKPKIKLTQTEYHILKGLEDKWKYIARNKKNGIKIHTTEPYKEDYIGSWSSYDRIDLPYEQLFKFIKWEDEEPYSIEELLKCEVVEDEN